MQMSMQMPALSHAPPRPEGCAHFSGAAARLFLGAPVPEPGGANGPAPLSVRYAPGSGSAWVLYPLPQPGGSAVLVSSPQRPKLRGKAAR